VIDRSLSTAVEAVVAARRVGYPHRFEDNPEFAALARSKPERARQLIALAQADIDEGWRLLERLAGVERRASGLPG
jgi:hypothetical protein